MILIILTVRTILSNHWGPQASAGRSEHLLEDRRDQQAGEVHCRLHEERHQAVRQHRDHWEGRPVEGVVSGCWVQDSGAKRFYFLFYCYCYELRKYECLNANYSLSFKTKQNWIQISSVDYIHNVPLWQPHHFNSLEFLTCILAHQKKI